MKIFILFIVLFMSEAWSLSAKRDHRHDFTHYESSYRKLIKNKLLQTPMGLAKLYNPNSVPSAVSWRSVELMQQRFQKIRDDRFLIWRRRQDFPRRISWLYPTDGCWIRAVLFNRGAFRLFAPLPNTIYAFGNLSVKTEYHRNGRASWWFHVASMVEVNKQKYVMDPMVNLKRPMLLEEWLKSMGDPSKIKIAVCKSGTFSPLDNCEKETNGMEIDASYYQQHYLDLEWDNLKGLGKNPEKELGNEPPWRK